MIMQLIRLPHNRAPLPASTIRPIIPQVTPSALAPSCRRALCDTFPPAPATNHKLIIPISLSGTLMRRSLPHLLLLTTISALFLLFLLTACGAGAGSSGTPSGNLFAGVVGEQETSEEPTEQSQNIDPGEPTTEPPRSEEHTSELQSPTNLVCRLLL